jgi:hypothetical protein
MKDIFRITIEQYDNKASVEVEQADLTVSEAMELIKRALLGIGYAQSSIEEYFDRK